MQDKNNDPPKTLDDYRPIPNARPEGDLAAGCFWGGLICLGMWALILWAIWG